MNEEVLEQIKGLRFGDRVEVDWWDHSKREMRLTPKGKLRPQIFDVPVHSIGWFFGVAGEETKHIVLARDIFVWQSMGDFDLDAIAILLNATKEIRVVAPSRLDPKFASQLKTAWEKGQVRIVKRGKRLRLVANMGESKS